MLEVTDLTKSFGGIQAIGGVSFTVEAGTVHAVIGPNGAGKTTLFNLLTGVYRPDGGSIRLAGEEIVGKPPEALARRGMSRTFQNLQVAMNMSALENVMLGAHLRTNHGLLAGMFLGTPLGRKLAAAEAECAARARELMAFAGVGAYADAQAPAMPFGALKRLEIARALASAPRLLLLDEPAAGLNHTETAEISALIARVAGTGVTVLLVEHDMQMVMSISERILVLDYGKTLAEGDPDSICRHPDVIKAYLGVAA